MKRTIFLILLFLVFAFPVYAQSAAPVLIDGTQPISTELRNKINAWLETEAPANAPYYAVTHFKTKASYTVVSLVALNLPTPEAAWKLEDNTQAVWIGSIRVYADGTVDTISISPTGKARAMPRLAAGGGPYVLFPWAAGSTMMYGPRAIHGSGDYGTNGMYAVDLVSGNDMGSSAAPDTVFASDAGVIDYVCNDGTSVGIRTHNSTTGDYFMYVHLLNNSNLEEETSFSKAQLIGSLKHGTFSGPQGYNCGNAQQQDNHYHLHWMFTPSNGSFQAEGCILNFSDKKWHCGTSEIGTGQWLTGGGGIGSGIDDPSLGTAGAGVVQNERSFWDYFLYGFISIYNTIFFQNLPVHQTFEYTYVLLNSITLTLKLAYVLLRFNINLFWLMFAVGVGIGIKLFFLPFQITAFLLKAYNEIFPKIPGLG